VRQCSMQRPMRVPTLVIVSSRISSGSRCSDARNSKAASTPVEACTGKQNALLSPARAALGARGKLLSWRTSAIHAGRPPAHTRPGRPSPGASTVVRLARSKARDPRQVSTQRTSPASPPAAVQTAPASHSSDSPIAASRRG
jgi:hypothetical protein